MRLARSRTAAGSIAPVVASGDRWFALSPLITEIEPGTRAGSTTGAEIAVDGGMAGLRLRPRP